MKLTALFFLGLILSSNATEDCLIHAAMHSYTNNHNLTQHRWSLAHISPFECTDHARVLKKKEIQEIEKALTEFSSATNTTMHIRMRSGKLQTPWFSLSEIHNFEEAHWLSNVSIENVVIDHKVTSIHRTLMKSHTYLNASRSAEKMKNTRELLWADNDTKAVVVIGIAVAVTGIFFVLELGVLEAVGSKVVSSAVGVAASALIAGSVVSGDYVTAEEVDSLLED
jgi:hypothetical protein